MYIIMRRTLSIERHSFLRNLSLTSLCGLVVAITFGCGGSGSTSGEGGTNSAGGERATGGSSNASNTTSVHLSTGGQVATGGALGVGGVSAAGGGVATGGKSATGGAATGGTKAAGDATSGATGGAAAGGAATGGSKAAGGSEAGGAATGGTKAAGGASETTTGGTKAAGGASGTATGGTKAAGGAGDGGTSAGGGSSNAAQSSGCGKAPTIASSQYNNGTTISITAGGMQRRYILNVPTNYVNTTPYKLVVAYHALDSNDKSVYSEKYYGLLSLSQNTTIFVAPNGEKNGAGCTGTGTGESGCGWPNTSDHDMQLADAVVAQVEENFCIDTNHIYATGWSYGASMSEQTACERPLGGTGAWGVRAIAIYAVAYLSNTTNCKASKPVAYYASHGTNDSVLSYSGGVSIAQTWAGVDGCTWATPPQASGSHICTKLTGCTAGYPLEFCSFVGPHTAYPDSGNESSSWGPQEVWTFLSQF